MAPSTRKPDGVWLLDKPAGVSSFDALQSLRPQLLDTKACHGGALDPFAVGLLPILGGHAVHLFHLIHELPKTYTATVSWGTETDNLDLLGSVIASGDASALTPEQLDAALPTHLGAREQVPPAFSNKRVGGERAWRLAREGRLVELPPEPVYLHEAKWLSHDLPRSSVLRLVCKGGYYVRALARDLGRLTGARAHLKALSRDAIGPWLRPAGGEVPRLTLEAAASWLPVRLISDEEMGMLRRKETLERGAFRAPEWRVPDGFPPVTFVRAVHLGRSAALLRITPEGLVLHALLY